MQGSGLRIPKANMEGLMIAKRAEPEATSLSAKGGGGGLVADDGAPGCDQPAANRHQVGLKCDIPTVLRTIIGDSAGLRSSS